MNKLLLGTALVFALGTSNVMAGDFSKSDIENIIKDYIQNNPEVILDSVEFYGNQKQQVEAADRQKSIEKHLTWLEDSALLPVAGNPDGDVTIVEFFDYNCGYCKKAVSDVMTLMEDDKNVKFIFVETPILGRTSEMAAKWAMAAQMQDAYLEYHIGLMQHRGPLNEMSLETVAKKVGLDIQKLRADSESDEIAKKVAEKSRKAAEMGISGTPAFVIGGQLYGGYIGLDKMREAVKEAREK
jgi:protein-disulfide isomerase